MSMSEATPPPDLSLRDLARFAEGQAGRLAAMFGFDPTAGDGHAYFALAQTVKLGEEVGELQAEVLGALEFQRREKAGRYSRDSLGGELADVMMCVAILADTFGVDLARAVGGKMEQLDARNRQERHHNRERFIIEKDFFTYTTIILRPDKRLRDHELTRRIRVRGWSRGGAFLGCGRPRCAGCDRRRRRRRTRSR